MVQKNEVKSVEGGKQGGLCSTLKGLTSSRSSAGQKKRGEGIAKRGTLNEMINTQENRHAVTGGNRKWTAFTELRTNQPESGGGIEWRDMVMIKRQTEGLSAWSGRKETGQGQRSRKQNLYWDKVERKKNGRSGSGSVTLKQGKSESPAGGVL